MAALDAADSGASCARRRRERRLRAFWKHELFAVGCAVATGTHHSASKGRRVDAETQTEERIQQRTVQHVLHSPMRQVVIPQERHPERIKEQTVDAPVPQDMKRIDRLCGARSCRRQETAHGQEGGAVAFAAPATVIENVALSPAVTCAAPAPTIESVSSSPAVAQATPKSVGEDWTPGIARCSVKSISDFAKSPGGSGSSWTRAYGTTSAAATPVVKSADEARLGTAKYRITTQSEHADCPGTGIAKCSAETVQDLTS